MLAKNNSDSDQMFTTSKVTRQVHDRWVIFELQKLDKNKMWCVQTKWVMTVDFILRKQYINILWWFRFRHQSTFLCLLLTGSVYFSHYYYLVPFIMFLERLRNIFLHGFQTDKLWFPLMPSRHIWYCRKAQKACIWGCSH